MADTRKVLADALDACDEYALSAESESTTVVDFVIRFLAERNVALVEDDGQHHAQVVSHGHGHWDWTIQHPARCRPDLIACPLNRQMNAYFEQAKLDGMVIETGRYDLDSDGARVTLR